MEDRLSFNTPHDNIMQHSFGIKAGMAGRTEMPVPEGRVVKSYSLIYGRTYTFPRNS